MTKGGLHHGAKGYSIVFWLWHPLRVPELAVALPGF